MKKLSTIIMAIALVLGLSQCKKQETPSGTNTEDGKVYITVNVDNVGGRHHIEPSVGAYVFTNGDVLYVGHGGQYVGTLEYENGAFTGEITPNTNIDPAPLHFYFLGGKGPQSPSVGTPSFTISIADQSSNLPILAYGRSSQQYPNSDNTYTCKLRNQCALVKFDLGAVDTDAPIALTGMKTEATINFADNTVTSVETTGNIVTYGTGTARYAIVLSDQSAVEEGIISSVEYIGTFSIPAASANAFLTNTSMTLAVAPLTLEALSAGTIVVNNPKSGMKYALNGEVQEGEPTSITVSEGDKVQLYGNGTSITSYYGTTIAGGDATVKVYGNIMSLVNETGYASATTLENDAFVQLFQGNTYLTDASGLLLPATTLASGCYAWMFNGCTSLTAAPTLPATMLASNCYEQMFSGCTSLTTAPAELPANTLAEQCYAGMFSGCTSLTTAPALPATTLARNCYRQMFDGCTSLNSVTCLATDISASNCIKNWLSNAGTNATSPKLYVVQSMLGASWNNGSFTVTAIP